MIKNYLKLFRLPQWIKNLFVFVPLIFSQRLFQSEFLLPVIFGFFVFCLTSSLVYVINDIIDVEADRAHPEKKFRPIASGKISKTAAIYSVFFLAVVIAIFLTRFNTLFIISISAYFILNVLYSSIFKHIVLLDIFSIAAGFMIRVLAGGFIINVEISSWLILTTMFISLFLGVMKRRSELKYYTDEDQTFTRKVLVHYSPNFTDQMATVAAAGVIICYALYTVSARTITVFKTENLIYTTPFVVFGIFRYMYLVYVSEKGENTSEMLVKDFQMIINIFLYTLTVIAIIYTR